MRMKGDLPTGHIVQLIELVLVVVVIGVILFMTVPQVSAWITRNVLNPLSGQGISLGSTESATLEDAIKCAYYRCTEGCGSADVKNIALGSKNCDDNYCKPFMQGGNGKVCGSNAQAHPVVVTLLDNEFIDKSKIQKGNLGFCMIIKDSSNGCNPATGKGWIYVDKSGTTDKAWEEEKCTVVPIIGEITGYSRIVINAGIYNVWTNDAGGTGVCLKS